MMGFEDRDYSQAESWNSAPSQEENFTKRLIFLMIAVFVFQLFSITPSSPNSVVFEWISLDAGDVLHGQVWRLLTYAISFDPDRLLALIFGLYTIWQVGKILERMYGSHELLLFNIAVALFVGVVFTAWRLVVPLELAMDGSGVLSLAMLALLAANFPRMQVNVIIVTIELRWLVALFALLDLHPALNALGRGHGVSSLAYVSNLLGIVFAVAYHRFHWHFSALTSGFNLTAWRRAWRNRRARQHLKVYQPSNDMADLDNKVDAILAKITDQGSESLTEAERDLLKRASERYKNR